MSKDFKVARHEFEDKICKFMDDIEGTKNGFNSTYYREYFATLSDNTFKKFVTDLANNEDFNLYYQVSQTDPKKAPTLEKIKKVGDKYNVPLEEYVVLPYKNPNDPEHPIITKTKVPVLYTLVRPLQQMIDKKNATSSDTSQVNVLTGSVTGKSKASTMSNMQVMSLTTSNQIKIIKEMLGPRSDDSNSKEKMLEQIENTGEYDLDNIRLNTNDKRSIQTTKAMLIAAGLRVGFNNEKATYLL